MTPIWHCTLLNYLRNETNRSSTPGKLVIIELSFAMVYLLNLTFNLKIFSVIKISKF